LADESERHRLHQVPRAGEVRVWPVVRGLARCTPATSATPAQLPDSERRPPRQMGVGPAANRGPGPARARQPGATDPADSSPDRADSSRPSAAARSAQPMTETETCADSWASMPALVERRFEADTGRQWDQTRGPIEDWLLSCWLNDPPDAAASDRANA